MYYANSITALQQLLFSGLSTPTSSAKEEEEEESDGNKKNIRCHITKKPQNISHMRNGVEYCSVEVTCDDGSQYGIQAYGDEAIDLYKEIYKCCMCGMSPKELEKSALVKKLRSVMGEEDDKEEDEYTY